MIEKSFWKQETKLKLDEENILISHKSMPRTEHSMSSTRITIIKNEAFFLTIMANLIGIMTMF